MSAWVLPPATVRASRQVVSTTPGRCSTCQARLELVGRWGRMTLVRPGGLRPVRNHARPPVARPRCNCCVERGESEALLQGLEAVSLVIPTRNAGPYARLMVRALAHQTVGKIDLIVVDSESDDGSPAVFAEFGARVLTIPRNSFNHGGARNLGARHARGEVLVFATQDAIPTDSRCLELLVRPLVRGSASAAFARQVPREGASPLERFARRENYPETARTVSLGDTRKLGVRALFFSNAFSAVLRDVFDALGGFPTHMVTNEDMLFAARLLKRAHRIAYVADATVVHSHSLGTGATFRRYFDIGTFFRQNAAELHGLRIGGGGVSYVVRLMRFLVEEGLYQWLVPASVESLVKWSGYSLGHKYRILPTWLVRRCSNLPHHWESGS